MRSMRTEKLSRNWRNRKSKWCLVQATKVGKKLSRNRRRGEDYLHSMVPFRLSFSPMRGISNRLITLLDSKKLHTIASVLLARRAKNNLNSPRGRFSSDKFSCDEEARLET